MWGSVNTLLLSSSIKLLSSLYSALRNNSVKECFWTERELAIFLTQFSNSKLKSSLNHLMMQVLKKLDMIRKNDIERILAERNILITVRNPFVVRNFSFFSYSKKTIFNIFKWTLKYIVRVALLIFMVIQHWWILFWIHIAYLFDNMAHSFTLSIYAHTLCMCMHESKTWYAYGLVLFDICLYVNFELLKLWPFM